jgi:hypothetical protein
MSAVCDRLADLDDTILEHVIFEKPDSTFS